MSEIKRESPLVGRSEALRGANLRIRGGVSLRERPFLSHISLRGKCDDTAFTDACAKVLGNSLPTTPNTQVEGDGVVVCWMGPTEWLVLAETEAGQGLLESLRAALAGIHSGVVELSGGQTLIEIRGEHAVDTLAKGTTIDLHPRHFGADRCTRTLLAKTTVFVRVVDPGQAFEIVVRRSFADHLWQWLRDSGHEYGCAVEPPQSLLQNEGRKNAYEAPVPRRAVRG
ncbi:MAG: sarcosine oxidase subunit gamma family protein [Salinisphaera sp.]|uniref:sarcosine oxidase subunit gamma n=1 Tax=Salinisphaera sp. TaxID=1914330 RepID=UPI003C79D9E6